MSKFSTKVNTFTTLTGPDRVAAMIGDKETNLSANHRNYLIGKVTLEELTNAKASVNKPGLPPTFDRKDFDRFCRRVGDECALKYGLKDPRPEDYVRYFLFIEKARTVVGDKAYGIPYGTVVNFHFGKMFAFSKSGLSADLNEREWGTTFAKVVETLVDVESPTRVRDAEAHATGNVQTLADAKLAKLSPEEQLAKATEAEAKEKASKKNRAIGTISSAAFKGLEDGDINPTDLMQTIDEIGRKLNVTMPTIGADPGTIDENGAEQFARVMFAKGRIDAMKRLYAVLGKMLQTIEASKVA